MRHQSRGTPPLHIPVTLLIALTVALCVVGAGSGDDAAAASAAVSRDRLVRFTSSREPKEVLRYWTKKRMLEAEPMPLARLSGPADVRPPRHFGSAGEDPTLVPGTAPRPRSAQQQAGPIPYVRSEVPGDYTTFPFSTSGKIFARDASGNAYVCSGTAVAGGNSSVVWTAGHCIYDPATGWSNSFVFVPAYKDGQTPLGQWPAETAFVPQGWAVEGSLRRDFAAVVVSPNTSGRRLTEVTGGRGIAWDLPRTQTFQAFGYPAAPPFTGQRMFTCVSQHGGDDLPPGAGPPTMAMGCDMTGGSSGGGWIIQDGRLNSNVSYGYQGQPEVFYGPYFDGTAGSLYEAASSYGVASPPPPPPPDSPPPPPPEESSVTHERSISVKVWGHLHVSGRLRAEDGYTPCVRSAPVRVLTKKRSSWRVVEKTTTNGRGRYSAAIRDRAGRYRVKSPTRSPDDLNECGATSSVVKRHRHTQGHLWSNQS